MKKNLLSVLTLFALPMMAQEITEPLIIPQLYTWRLSPNGKYLSGGTSEYCDIFNLETRTLETYPGARYKTLTNGGIVTTGGMGKPALLIDGVAVVPESLAGARSGSIQCISSTGNRLCGSINYPAAGINGFYACDIDEKGVVGEPKPIPRPTLDCFGCKPQFVNMLEISADGSTITGFVQDWRGYYCYPIIFRENEEGEWDYYYPTETLFNPENYSIPDNPWLNEPKFPNFTDFMTPQARTAYEDALANYYMGLGYMPDAKDFMTEEQWQAYYDAAIYYNDWYYGQEDRIKAYDTDYNRILNSSVIFDLNEVAISPDGSMIACSYIEYTDGKENVGIIRINTKTPEFQKYVTDVYEPYPTQVLSDGTILISQPMIYEPQTYLILPESEEVISIWDYFMQTHPDYWAWMDKYLRLSGTIYTNDDMTMFAGSMLPADCDTVEELTGGYYAFTYVFLPELAGVENIEVSEPGKIVVFNLQGHKVLNSQNREDLKKLQEGIYVVNGKKVYLNNNF